MYLSELQNKDIISIKSGMNLGRIIDAEVNNEGMIINFVAEDRKLLKKVFRNNDFTFNFNDIEKIGTDCILVKK